MKKLTLSGGSDTFNVGPTYIGFNVDGAGGNDTIVTSYGNDTVAGGAGNDYIYSQGGNDVLSGGDGDDTVVYGGDWKAVLSGGAGNDQVIDWGGNATLNGGAGSDMLLGTGRDVMTGGTGGDTFTFVWTGRPIETVVKDFSLTQGDKIDLGQLGTWWEDGYHPITEADLEIQGKNLIVHTDFTDAVIIGVGQQLELIGLPLAISHGIIVLEGGIG